MQQLLPLSPIPGLAGPYWLLLLSLAVGALVRAVKSGAFDRLLQSLKLPSIPRQALPAIAVVLGGGESFVQGWLQTGSAKVAAQQLLLGLLAGSLPVAAHEALAPNVARGALATFLFGPTNPTTTNLARRVTGQASQALQAAREKPPQP